MISSNFSYACFNREILINNWVVKNKLFFLVNSFFFALNKYDDNNEDRLWEILEKSLLV